MIQLNSSKSQTNVCKIKSNADSLPAKHETVGVGDVCIFHSTEWAMGRVVRFFYHNSKSSKAQQCKLSSLTVDSNKSVVCSLFHWHPLLSL